MIYHYHIKNRPPWKVLCPGVFFWRFRRHPTWDFSSWKESRPVFSQFRMYQDQFFLKLESIETSHLSWSESLTVFLQAGIKQNPVFFFQVEMNQNRSFSQVEMNQDRSFSSVGMNQNRFFFLKLSWIKTGLFLKLDWIKTSLITSRDESWPVFSQIWMNQIRRFLKFEKSRPVFSQVVMNQDRSFSKVGLNQDRSFLKFEWIKAGVFSNLKESRPVFSSNLNESRPVFLSSLNESRPVFSSSWNESRPDLWQTVYSQCGAGNECLHFSPSSRTGDVNSCQLTLPDASLSDPNTKWLRLISNGENPGNFSDQISVHFGAPRQNVLKSDLKNSPGFSIFETNLTHFWPNLPPLAYSTCNLHDIVARPDFSLLSQSLQQLNQSVEVIFSRIVKRCALLSYVLF